MTNKYLALIAIFSLLNVGCGTESDDPAPSEDFATLPEVDYPFDVEQFGKIDIPERDNAYVLYIAATEQMKPTSESAGNSAADAVNQANWSLAKPIAREWLTSNRALDTWRLGTEKNLARYYQPNTANFRTELTVTSALRSFGILAILNGLRLQEAGENAGSI